MRPILRAFRDPSLQNILLRLVSGIFAFGGGIKSSSSVVKIRFTSALFKRPRNNRHSSISPASSLLAQIQRNPPCASLHPPMALETNPGKDRPHLALKIHFRAPRSHSKENRRHAQRVAAE